MYNTHREPTRGRSTLIIKTQQLREIHIDATLKNAAGTHYSFTVIIGQQLTITDYRYQTLPVFTFCFPPGHESLHCESSLVDAGHIDI